MADENTIALTIQNKADRDGYNLCVRRANTFRTQGMFPQARWEMELAQQFLNSIKERNAP